MSIESTPKQETSEIIWSATSERFTKKVDQELSSIESIPGIDINTNERYQKLVNLKETIGELFTSYEDKKLTIQKVEGDLKYRIENEENENKVKEYEQILNFVNAKFDINI